MRRRAVTLVPGSPAKLAHPNGNCSVGLCGTVTGTFVSCISCVEVRRAGTVAFIPDFIGLKNI